MTVKTLVWSICFIYKIIMKITLKKLVSWNGLDKTHVGYEDRLLQRDVGDGRAGLAHADLGGFPLVLHLPQLGVFKVRSHVRLPVARGPELLVTVRTSERSHSCVQADVHFEAPGRGEALHAVRALEGLDARVRFDVRGQRALDREGPEALRALERLLVRVDADVTHQVAGLPELLGAVGTYVPADAVLLADGTG